MRRRSKSTVDPTVDPSVDAGDEGEPAECPYCGSGDTYREHPKGPSLCRSMHYCNGCEQPFEAME